jgi:hypothetical protein
MAKRKASGTSKAASSKKKSTKTSARKTAAKKPARAAAKAARPAKKAAAKKKSAARGRTAAPRRSAAKKAAAPKKAAAARTTAKGRLVKKPAARKTAPASRGDARRRSIGARLDQREETVPTPPSSLNMNRHGSAARTGRDEMAEERADHANMTPTITGGDVDADVENAYFSGDEAPGGDNPTPDQDIVDDIGRALGVEYQDNEELRASDKVAARDKHRWELDPASSEDYKDRK